MKTLKEKFDYNSSQKNGFSMGYCCGVKYYQSYGSCRSQADRTKRKEYIDDMKSAAKKYSYAKGFMCGIRDAANDRKAKKN